MSASATPSWPELNSLAAQVRSGSRAAAAWTEQALARIDRDNPRLRAFVHVDPDGARTRAAALDAQVAAGRDPGPLAGVPVAIKDNICRRGWPMSCGARLLDNFVAPYDALVLRRLEAAGAVLIGSCNMDAFGMGNRSRRSIHGATRNPHDLSRSPGGSSGGSAAAVAAGMVPLALGSDTGGSVRQPAAWCGVSGLKPSYGRIPRQGLTAYASSLDCVGLLARHSADLQLALTCLSGPAAEDPTSLDQAPPTAVPVRLQDLRLGTWSPQNLSPTLSRALEESQALWRSQGCRLEAVDLPHLDFAVPTYYLIASTEAATNLARFDGLRFGRRTPRPGDLQSTIRRSRSEGFDPEVQRRILLGCLTMQRGHAQRWYDKACQLRTLICRDFEAAFADHDLLLLPSSLEVAAAQDAPPAEGRDSHDELTRDLCTIPASLTGLPALSLPCGFDPSGLPIGMQLIAPPGQEAQLLAAAAAFQDLSDHHLREARP